MNKKLKSVTLGIILFIIWLLVFNFSMFFGLQVSTTLGNIGIIVTIILAVVFIKLHRKMTKKG